MSDLFVGVKKCSDKEAQQFIKDGERVVKIDKIDFARSAFDNVDLYDCMYNLAYQILLKASLDYRALFTAGAEVFSGLGTNLTNQFNKLRGK